MQIPLTTRDIDIVLPHVDRGLRKYVSIQREFPQVDVRHNVFFRKAFNGFYRVRRSEEWQTAFFRLLEEGKTRRITFGEALDQLHGLSGCQEASFASKLVATLNPNLPVIDSVVLRNIGGRIPTAGSKERRLRTLGLYERMGLCFEEFLRTATGRYLVAEFRNRYGDQVTETKMVDLVLWQKRQRRGEGTGRSAERRSWQSSGAQAIASGLLRPVDQTRRLR